jgi:hypothetical protein
MKLTAESGWADICLSCFHIRNGLKKSVCLLPLLFSFVVEYAIRSVQVNQDVLKIKNAYVSVRREVLHNILIEFNDPMKLVRLIKICLNETYSSVRVGKHLSDIFPYWEWFEKK